MPDARQNSSKLAEMFARASSFNALVGMAVDVVTVHGVAFLRWNHHPEPSGSRRATPLLLFQHRLGHSGGIRLRANARSCNGGVRREAGEGPRRQLALRCGFFTGRHMINALN